MRTLFLALCVVGIFVVVGQSQAASLADRLAGRILLQVERKGEAWYVNPVTKLRYYLGRPQDAFDLMRSQGLGISNKDLAGIPIGFHSFTTAIDSDQDSLPDTFEDAIGTDKAEPDTDGDGHNDGTEVGWGYNPLGLGKMGINKFLVTSTKGKIVLQVESHGEAWYVNPVNGLRFFLGRPQDAFAIMREQGLGITDQDLNTLNIGVDTSGWTPYQNEELGFEISLPPGWQQTSSGSDSVTFSDGAAILKIYSGPDKPISELLPFEAYTISNDAHPVYTKISGDEFIELRWNRLPEGSTVTDIYNLEPTSGFPHNGRHYALIAYAEEGRSFNDVQARIIMGTFRFLPTVADASNWLSCASNYGFQYSYPPEWKFWKRGEGERIESACDTKSYYVTLSPSVHSEENIHIGVFNKETQPGTVYAENYSSLDQYFALRPAVLKASPIVKEIEIDGVRAIQLRRGDVLMYYHGSIIEVTREHVDDIIFEGFLNKFDFTGE